MNSHADKPILSLIAAVAANGAIGKGGVMPWHLPGDLRYFKKITMGKPVIMGQKTWESLRRRPLPGRVNIILTRQKSFSPEGGYVAHSLAEAVRFAEKQAHSKAVDEIFIIGGGDVFKQALPWVDRIYLTEIQADIEGDTFFKPSLPCSLWRKKKCSAVERGERDSHAYRFLVYEKRGGKK